jgi:plasmid maintenance system antidote protein VapI
MSRQRVRAGSDIKKVILKMQNLSDLELADKLNKANKMAMRIVDELKALEAELARRLELVKEEKKAE